MLKLLVALFCISAAEICFNVKVADSRFAVCPDANNPLPAWQSPSGIIAIEPPKRTRQIGGSDFKIRACVGDQQAVAGTTPILSTPASTTTVPTTTTAATTTTGARKRESQTTPPTHKTPTYVYQKRANQTVRVDIPPPNLKCPCMLVVEAFPVYYRGVALDSFGYPVPNVYGGLVDGGGWCTGDSTYLSDKLAVVPATYGHPGYYGDFLPSKCTCTTYFYSVITEYYIGGVWVIPTQITIYVKVTDKPAVFSTAIYTPEPFGFDVGQMKKRAEPMLILSPRAVSTATMEGVNLIVTTTQPQQTTVTVNKDGLNIALKCAEIKCINTIPDDFFLNPGFMTVRVYYGDVLDSTTEIRVESFVRCQVPRCIFCQSMVTDFSCFPWQFQMFIVLVCIVAILAIILLTWKIITSSQKIQCCRKGCRKGKKIIVQMKEKVAKRFRRDPNAPVEPDSDDDSGDNDILSETNQKGPSIPLEPIQKTTTAPTGKWRVPKLFLVMMFLLPMCSAASCANGITVPVELTSCVAIGQTETCSVTMSALASIPSTGLSACLSFVKVDGTVIGSMTVTYKQLLRIAPLQSLYWTGDWAPASYSIKECQGSQHCGSCSSFNPLANPRACDVLNGNPATPSDTNCLLPITSLFYPGETLCSSQDGCAANGCFLCGSACIYSRAYLITTGVICNVLKPVAVYLRPQLEINMTINGVTTITTVNIANLDTVVGNNMTITMNGNLQGSDSFIQNQAALVCDDGHKSLGFAANPNAPVKNGIGDIQANTYEALNGANGNFQFQYAAGIINPQPTTSVTTYVFPSAGINARSTNDLFPTFRGSVLWSIGAGNMYGLDQDPPSVLFTIATTQPYILRRTVNVVCPKIVSYNITGCYNCDQGATITILARSTCNPGLASITMTGATIATPNINMDTSNQYFEVKFNGGTEIVEGILKISAGTYSDEIHYSGSLYAESLLVFGNGTFTDTSAGTAPLNLDGIASWFDGLASWMKGLFLTGVILAAIVGGIIGTVYLVRCIKARQRQKKIVQYRGLDQAEKSKLVEESQLNAMQ